MPAPVTFHPFTLRYWAIFLPSAATGLLGACLVTGAGVAGAFAWGGSSVSDALAQGYAFARFAAYSAAPLSLIGATILALVIASDRRPASVLTAAGGAALAAPLGVAVMGSWFWPALAVVAGAAGGLVACAMGLRVRSEWDRRSGATS